MAGTDSALGIIFRTPQLGKVKGRLAARLGEAEALRLYRCMLNQTFKMAEGLKGISVFGFYEGPLKGHDYPGYLTLYRQQGSHLGERMLNAFVRLFDLGFKRACLIGSDSPTLPVDFVYDAFEALGAFDIVIGPSEDGGYYLIGTKRPMGFLFSDLPWGGGDVFQSTLQKAQDKAVSYYLLPMWYDLDRVEDLERLDCKLR